MAMYGHLNTRGKPLTCVPCAISFETERDFDKHCTYVDVPSHRFCASCNIVFPTLTRFRDHHTEMHDIVELVSPEAQRVQRQVAQEERQQDLPEEEQDRREAAREQKKLEKAERKRLKKAEKKKKELEQRRKELEGKGPVFCVVCSKKFDTPAAYAQHLESGTHSTVKRHHVTQVVHMLDVVPPITLEPSLPYLSAAGTEGYTTSTIADISSIPSSPTASEASLPQQAGSLSGSVVLSSSISSAALATHGTHLASPTGSPFDPAINYTPNDFAHLGIPYACALCFKTFRNVVQLTAHMNSPVHDPDAFKCPGPKCGRQFALISGLIQHLESGCCKLASAGEIFERFALLTARFSKYLAV